MNRAHIERISKALADQTRLMMFEAIAKRKELNCGDIVNLRGVTPATVSHHLKILSDAGLIECRRDGQFVRSRIVPEQLEEYSRALAQLSGGKRRAARRK
jgi:DNA-binding transcriptional ArsR family regulator